MERIETIPPRLIAEKYSGADMQEIIFCFDGEKVLGVCKCYISPDSKPFYFDFSPSGFRQEMSKTEFLTKLEQLKAA